MRTSELYFVLAILFAALLTWRLTGTFRKTMKQPRSVRDDETDE
ncbi:hypothetical protein [Alicyclobacillus fodiniaquatilis]|uniref:Uncharacterized protein n=1 Tax=Alicyclobacillus fodiniaquatilis TaxID=1661150 RepID=A0ABW4JMN9_9BACL